MQPTRLEQAAIHRCCLTISSGSTPNIIGDDQIPLEISVLNQPVFHGMTLRVLNLAHLPTKTSDAISNIFEAWATS
jgi:hypothetical protein